jgi:hypothetical protein
MSKSEFKGQREVVGQIVSRETPTINNARLHLLLHDRNRS